MFLYSNSRHRDVTSVCFIQDASLWLMQHLPWNCLCWGCPSNIIISQIKTCIRFPVQRMGVSVRCIVKLRSPRRMNHCTDTLKPMTNIVTCDNWHCCPGFFFNNINEWHTSTSTVNDTSRVTKKLFKRKQSDKIRELRARNIASAVV